MQPERRALVVAAKLEAPEPLDRGLVALHVHLVDLAPQLAHLLERRLHVLDLDEEEGSRPGVAAVHPAGHVRRGDHEAASGRPRVEPPAEQLLVERPPALGVSDTQLEERQLACHRSLLSSVTDTVRPVRSPVLEGVDRDQATASSWWQRSSIALRICFDTSGSSRSMCRKAEPVSTSTVTGEGATTDALRVTCPIRPISPKKSPGPSSASSWSPRLTSAAPSSMAKNSYANSPSRTRWRPGSTSTSSASLATSRRSFFPSPSNSGIARSRASSISSPSVRDQALSCELALRLLERHVARREDHVRLDQLVVVERVAVARHQLEHLGPELAEADLVALLDRAHGAVVQLVEAVGVLVGQAELALPRDPDDHAFSFPCSSAGESPPPLPSSAFIFASSSSTCAPLVSSFSWRSMSSSPGPSWVMSSKVPAASSSSTAPARARICSVLSSARCIASPRSAISSPTPEAASPIRTCASAAEYCALMTSFLVRNCSIFWRSFCSFWSISTCF